MGLSSAVDLARALRIPMKESLSGLCTTFSVHLQERFKSGFTMYTLVEHILKL
jgi:hypothetical protein